MAIKLSELLVRATSGIMSMNSLAKSYGYASDDQIDIESMLRGSCLATVCNMTKEETESQSVKRLRSKPIGFTLLKEFENGSYEMDFKIGLDSSRSVLSKYSVSTMDASIANATWMNVFKAIGNIYTENVGEAKDTESFNLQFTSNMKEDLLPVAFTVNGTEYDMLKIEIDAKTNKPVSCVYGPLADFLNQESITERRRLFIKDDSLRDKSIELLKIDVRTKLLSQIVLYDCSHAYEDAGDVYAAEHMYGTDLKESSISLTYAIENFVKHYCK